VQAGVAPSRWTLDESGEVLRLALSAYESSHYGGVGVDPTTLSH
jgi:hypothetical protein